jgi:NADPH:quinone reductase-like Zn-dependent oxidoreductase
VGLTYIAYAPKDLAAAVNVIPMPDTLGFTEAASVPLVFLTAFHMLTGRANIRLGQTVLVLGANSGVGIAAIQLAKLFQATVIATAGDDRKAELAKQLGADYVINHYQQKIGDEARKITGRAGVDIVVEHVGAATWNESMKALKGGGTLVTCGATSGPEASFDLRVLFARHLALLGSYMGTMGELHEVLRLVFSGKLKPVVDKVFPLREVRAAHEYLQESKMFGKVVLIP